MKKFELPVYPVPEDFPRDLQLASIYGDVQALLPGHTDIYDGGMTEEQLRERHYLCVKFAHKVVLTLKNGMTPAEAAWTLSIIPEILYE